MLIAGEHSVKIARSTSQGQTPGGSQGQTPEVDSQKYILGFKLIWVRVGDLIGFIHTAIQLLEQTQADAL